jgi:hypothetical protein
MTLSKSPPFLAVSLSFPDPSLVTAEPLGEPLARPVRVLPCAQLFWGQESFELGKVTLRFTPAVGCRVSGHSQDATAIREQLIEGFRTLCAWDPNWCLQIEVAQ